MNLAAAEPRSEPQPGASGRATLAWGASAGAAFGLLDAALSAAADTLPAATGRVLALAALQALALAPLSAVAAAIAARLTRRWRLPGPGLALGVGLATPALLDAAERWFRAPPPFSQPGPLHGSALVFGAGVAFVLIFIFLILKHLPQRAQIAVFSLVLSIGTAARAPTHTRLAARGTPDGARPPVVLLTMDTTRDDHVSQPDNPTRTATFDALAAGGARLDLAMSQIPVTGPSHTTILSGEGPWTHGVMLNGHALPAALPLLPEVLRAQGYRTGAFVSAYVLEGSFGFNRGFEVYDDDFGALPGWSDTLSGRLGAGLERHLHPDLALERPAADTVDHALRWLEAEGLGERDAPPFFLWVHVFDPHGPYAPPEPWASAYFQGDPRDPSQRSMEAVTGVAAYLAESLRGVTDLRWVLAQYAGEVSYADAELGRLLAWLDAKRPGALVVLSGDHGESLGEHGVWFNHGDDLFDPCMHVPLVFRLGGAVQPGLRLPFPVELLDIAPTLYDLLGVEVPDAVEGRSLAPWLRGVASPEAPPHPFARSLTFDRPANVAARQAGQIDAPRWRMASLRSTDGRYLLREAPGQGEAWYDLGAAADESVIGAPPEGLGLALRAAAEALLRGEAKPAVEDLDPSTADRLKALGYVDE